MTVHEIAETAGVTPETVKNAIRARWPERMEKGKVTHLGYHEAVEIMGDIRKKGFITPSQPTKDLQAPTKDLQVALPSGAALRELRLLVKAGILTQSHAHRILGLGGEQLALPEVRSGSVENALAGAMLEAAGSGISLTPRELHKAESAAVGAFAGALRRAIDRASADRAQGRLL